MILRFLAIIMLLFISQETCFAQQNRSIEINWEQAEKKDTVEAFQSFLETYPTLPSSYASLTEAARLSILSLELDNDIKKMKDKVINKKIIKDFLTKEERESKYGYLNPKGILIRDGKLIMSIRNYAYHKVDVQKLNLQRVADFLLIFKGHSNVRGFTFDGDYSSPLIFLVSQKDSGLIYLRGKGSVKCKDGEEIIFK